MHQSTSTILMIRPLHFSFNEQTAASNSFQNVAAQNNLLAQVQKEFDGVVDLLRSNGIEVLVFEDNAEASTPDSIFPNNWISINNNTITVYPMMADNRRTERRTDVIDFLKKRHNNEKKLLDLTGFENENKYLEGTGSLVLDHENKLAFASLSPRTHFEVVNKWCMEFNYKPITFTSFDRMNKSIYHTNVMMTIGTGYVVLAADTIINDFERKEVAASLEETGHELVLITNEQMSGFAGNMLELENKTGKKFLLMSETAYKILSLAQIEQLKKHTQILVCYIPAIEETGGGSIRCMIAEVFN